VFEAIMKEAVMLCSKKVEEKDRELQLKNSQLLNLRSEVATLKHRFASPISHESTTPTTKLPHQKSLSRSTFLEFQVLHPKPSR
jgi:hypothetical protein